MNHHMLCQAGSREDTELHVFAGADLASCVLHGAHRA